MITLNEKIREIISAHNLSDRQFAIKIGVTQSVISSMFQKGTEPSAKVIRNTLSAFPEVSSDWFLKDEGDMLKDQSNAKEIGGAYVASSQDDDVVMVPFIPISAQASFIDTLTSISNDTWLDTLPVIPTDAERANIDAYRIFEVEGDSMTPTVPNGALVLAQEVPEARWHYAEGVVVIGYAEYIVIKRIEKNRLASDNYLILSSDNPRYGSMQVALADIRCIYRAKRIISADIN